MIEKCTSSPAPQRKKPPTPPQPMNPPPAQVSSSNTPIPTRRMFHAQEKTSSNLSSSFDESSMSNNFSKHNLKKPSTPPTRPKPMNPQYPSNNNNTNNNSQRKPSPSISKPVPMRRAATGMSKSKSFDELLSSSTSTNTITTNPPPKRPSPPHRPDSVITTNNNTNKPSISFTAKPTRPTISHQNTSLKNHEEPSQTRPSKPLPRPMSTIAPRTNNQSIRNSRYEGTSGLSQQPSFSSKEKELVKILMGAGGSSGNLKMTSPPNTNRTNNDILRKSNENNNNNNNNNSKNTSTSSSSRKFNNNIDNSINKGVQHLKKPPPPTPPIPRTTISAPNSPQPKPSSNLRQNSNASIVSPQVSRKKIPASTIASDISLPKQNSTTTTATATNNVSTSPQVSRRNLTQSTTTTSTSKNVPSPKPLNKPSFSKNDIQHITPGSQHLLKTPSSSNNKSGVKPFRPPVPVSVHQPRRNEQEIGDPQEAIYEMIEEYPELNNKNNNNNNNNNITPNRTSSKALPTPQPTTASAQQPYKDDPVVYGNLFCPMPSTPKRSAPPKKPLPQLKTQ